MPREGQRKSRKPKYGPWGEDAGTDRADQYRTLRSMSRGSASTLRKTQKMHRIAGKADENPQLIAWHQSHRSLRGDRPI